MKNLSAVVVLEGAVVIWQDSYYATAATNFSNNELIIKKVNGEKMQRILQLIGIKKNICWEHLQS